LEEDTNAIKNNNGNIKKIVITVIAIIVAILIIMGIVKAVRPTPEKTVKKFVEYMNKGDIESAYKLINIKGAYVFSGLSSSEYKDFKEEYTDLDDSDWEDIEEMFEEFIEDNSEDLADDISDYEEYLVEFKNKKLKSTKVGTGLYKVKAKIKTVIKEDSDSKTERDTDDYVFYLMKKENKYYIVGATGGNLFDDLIDY